MKNDFFIDNNTIEIDLGKTGGTALIDLDDFQKVSSQNWNRRCGRDLDNFYVRATTGRDRMHRVVFPEPIPRGWFVDHINGNTLDNRKSNLRLITRAMNRVNSKKSRGFYPYGNKWVAKIRVEKRLIHLGTFETPEEARAARLAAEKYHFGEFAPERNP